MKLTTTAVRIFATLLVYAVADAALTYAVGTKTAPVYGKPRRDLVAVLIRRCPPPSGFQGSWWRLEAKGDNSPCGGRRRRGRITLGLYRPELGGLLLPGPGYASA
jgi:hypothetical protein